MIAHEAPRRFMRSTTSGAQLLLVMVCLLLAIVSLGVLLSGDPARAAECDTATSHEQQAVCQSISPAAVIDQSPTNLTTTATQLIAANPKRATLTIQNKDAAITECFSVVNTTAVCGAKGTYDVLPGHTLFWPRGSAPAGALYGKSASGTPLVNVFEGQ